VGTNPYTRLEANHWKGALQKRAWGFMVNTELSMCQRCALGQRGPTAFCAALGNVAGRLKDLILLFYSALLRPYLEYRVQFRAH